jgi:hypothetical protein
VSTSCGSAGASGCGGQPGQGGQGGQGGGSSVALYVWDAKVTMIGGALRAGNGGTGGAGGPGGLGGAGGTGANGAAATSCDTACGTQIPAFKCGPVQSTAAAGGTGSRGGAGGRGAPGGGGAGGSTFAAVEGGVARVTISNAGMASGIPGASRGNGPTGRTGSVGQ